MRPTDFIFILIPAMATLALSAIALKLVGQMTRKNSTWCFWLAVGIGWTCLIMPFRFGIVPAILGSLSPDWTPRSLILDSLIQGGLAAVAIGLGMRARTMGSRMQPFAWMLLIAAALVYLSVLAFEVTTLTAPR